MDDVQEGLNKVVHRESEEPKSRFFLPKTDVFSAKFALEIIFDEASFVEYQVRNYFKNHGSS